MSNLDYNLPEPTKAQLEYARYLSRFQAPRERRTLFARTESDIAAAFREETANHSWNADDLASGRYRSPVCRCSAPAGRSPD